MGAATAEKLESMFVSLREGARIAECDEDTLRKIAEKGKIRVRRVPGARPKYKLTDILAMVESALTPAN